MSVAKKKINNRRQEITREEKKNRLSGGEMSLR